jgi:dephospho-CoA kinase
VAAVLAGQGLRLIDVDRVGHQVLREPAIRERVVATYGRSVLGKDGEVDRRALGRRVFRDRRALRALERIVHPPMVERVRADIASGSGPVLVNAALLFRMGLDRLCDAVLCVRAPLRSRIARARRRDGIGLLATLRRIASQRGICPKLRGAGVDIYYVGNDGGLGALREGTLRLLSRLRQKGLEL